MVSSDSRTRLYKKIRDAGFIIKLRRVAVNSSGNKKGNVDSELILFYLSIIPPKLYNIKK